jgi:glycosyltransferase involved in cell wall biosynthesis
MTRRLLFDISTSMKWFGPPVGIVRVERELAKWAMHDHPDCRFGFFDPDLQLYRQVLPDYLPAILDGTAMVDTTGMADPSQSRRRRTDRVPRILRTPFLWLTQFRRMALRTLGGMLLKSRSARVRGIIHRLQPAIAGKKYREILLGPGGRQRAIASVNALTGSPIALERGDVVLFAGSNWAHGNAAAIGQWRKQSGIELIALCHDVIPLLFPQWFSAKDVALVRRHFDQVFAVASLNLVASRVVGRDVQAYCAGHGIAAGPVMQIPFGFDLPADGPKPAGPNRVRPGSRYILLVSTIEPRKGHGLMQVVWSRLLKEGIPQKLDVTLVLVGRAGWLIDGLVESLLSSQRIAVLDEVEDAVLAGLYDGADFCIYPSEYEGYGLPVVEALARGKAVLASDVGVVPEIQSPLLKRLPARDKEVWHQAIRTWLTSPEIVPRADAAFDHPTWQQAAARVFAVIDEFNDRGIPSPSATSRSVTSRGADGA